MNWKDKFPKENRYFETNNGILYCGDCLEIMKKFSENSIDLVLTDPPYGKDSIHLYWDSLSVCKNSLKNKSFVVYYMPEYWFDIVFSNLISILNYYMLVHLATKGNTPFLFPRNYRIGCKTLVVLSKGKIKNPRRAFNLIESPERKTGELHKWQQSLYPIEKLVSYFSNENDLVLDPFIGSGTIAVAAEKLNRRWLGIEINPEYCEIAKKRLLNMQLELDISLK